MKMETHTHKTYGTAKYMLRVKFIAISTSIKKEDLKSVA